ncbi:MAG TPA: hypothetical protein O0Y16_01155, partial [Methanocorpusculum sp.]|nr:hypothetical protein [Methanocorpusculum sp.]
MAVTFEVIHKDIAGRVGKLKAGDKMMRTPGLLPVVNLESAHFQAFGETHRNVVHMDDDVGRK